ncbi:MAG: aminoacetone oxidase family FAD-binding enzyme, partial [Gallionella sp.]|nr:aminoacetone oxidase family FAD-binding enzyme [Gallionella sp.]
LKAGLVPLTFAPDEWKPYADLTGVSFPAIVTTGKQSFRESLLVTHRGLSGPVILQASSYWQPGEALHINLLPDCDAETLLTEQKTSKKLLSNYLIQWFPKSFAEIWCEQNKSFENKPLNQYNDKQRKAIAVQLHDWQVIPSGTQGYTKAEVTCGGVDTHALSSKTMECLEVPGLYFIGEVVDVTGQLGGYNFQWAWASGFAAGQAV